MGEMKTIYIVIISIVLASCATWKTNLVTQGDYNIAIQNAINDFSNKSSLYKEDTVFSIGIENISEEILGISIIGQENKLLPTSKNKIGTNYPYFPTRYMELNSKLFIWYDSSNSVSRDIVFVLSKYNLIDSTNLNGVKGIPGTSSIINDTKQAEQYFFCKSNLRKYKRVRSNIAIGYYDPPNLNCKP